MTRETAEGRMASRPERKQREQSHRGGPTSACAWTLAVESVTRDAREQQRTRPPRATKCPPFVAVFQLLGYRGISWRRVARTADRAVLVELPYRLPIRSIAVHQLSSNIL